MPGHGPPRSLTRRTVLAGLGTAAAGVLAAGTRVGVARAPHGEDTWAQANANAANTARLPDGHGPASDVGRGWSYDADYYHDGVAVVGATVYVGGKALAAVEADTGAERWRFEPDEGERERYREGNTPEFGTPAVADGAAYAAVGFGTYDDHRIPREDFLAVDASTGAQRWRFDPEGSRDFSDPTVAEGTVFTRCTWESEDRAQTLYALDPDGSVAWERAVPDGRAPVAVADGLVYAAGSEGVVAADAGSGDTVWRALEALSLESAAAPVVAHDAVYVAERADPDATLVALEAATGAERWRTVFDGERPRLEVGAVDAEGIYLQDGSRDADVIALARDGTERWRTTVDAEGDGYLPTRGLARVGDLLYAGASALDPADGSVVWSRAMDEYVAYGLDLDAVAGGRAYLLGSEVATLVGPGDGGGRSGTATTTPSATPDSATEPSGPTSTSGPSQPRDEPGPSGGETSSSPSGTRDGATASPTPAGWAAGRTGQGDRAGGPPDTTETARAGTAGTPGSPTRGVGPGFGGLVGLLGLGGGLAALVRTRLRDDEVE